MTDPIKTADQGKRELEELRRRLAQLESLERTRQAMQMMEREEAQQRQATMQRAGEQDVIDRLRDIRGNAGLQRVGGLDEQEASQISEDILFGAIPAPADPNAIRQLEQGNPRVDLTPDTGVAPPEMQQQLRQGGPGISNERLMEILLGPAPRR